MRVFSPTLTLDRMLDPIDPISPTEGLPGKINLKDRFVQTEVLTHIVWWK